MSVHDAESAHLISVSGIEAEIIFKAIKHIHISVYPPDGRVRVAAPHRIDAEAIRLAVIQRLPWIRKQQDRLRSAERQPERQMVSGETHYVWGQRYLLDVSRTGRHHIELDHHTLWLVAPRGADMASRRRVLDRWYRKQLTDALPPLLDKWLPIVGEQPSRVEIRRMRTKWGSCSSHNRQIRLNPELATLHPRCLEYVLVHELAHLIERTHSRGFHALLDDFLPAWRSIRDELNEHPIPYSLWGPGSHGDVD